MNTVCPKPSPKKQILYKHKAEFVSLEPEKKETFKYRLRHKINVAVLKLLLSWKREFNSIAQKPQLWLSKINWKSVKSELLEWIVDVLIEGISINFVMHYLFGFKFTFMTAIAYGVLAMKLLEYYRKVKTYGASSKAFNKNK